MDVQANCIVETDRFWPYLTLSYIWGNVNNLRLTRANKSQMCQPGTLGHELKWSRLPRTVRDAILLARILRQPLLWVDSLCLVQNEPDDVRAGTAVMDLIYELSALTIIAATGHDSNAGLPGVREASRSVTWTHQPQIIYPSVAMMVHTTLEGLLRRSVYKTRAWT